MELLPGDQWEFIEAVPTGPTYQWTMDTEGNWSVVVIYHEDPMKKETDDGVD